MNCTRRTSEIVTLALTLLLAGAVRVQAQDPSTGTVTVPADLPPYYSPLVGVTGTGTTSTVSCPRYAVMIGVAGTRAKFLSTITPLCSVMNKDGSTSPLAADPVALSGASTFSLQCGTGRVITRVGVAYTNSSLYRFFSGVEIGCSPWTMSTWSGAIQTLATGSFSTYTSHGSVACNSQVQSARALRIRRPTGSLTGVIALGIICDEL